jgi:F-type H+-transporting ATPase subunit delta
MIRAASRHAMADLRGHLDEVTAPMSAADLTTLAGELYDVAALLIREPRLRRTVGDPSTRPESRAEFIGGLLEGQVGAHGRDVVQAAVSQRWSSPWDLTDGLDLAGDDCLLHAAETDGVLDEIEDELFRLERILDANSRLMTLLDEVSVSAERRVALLRSILAGKVHDATEALVEHAVASPRRRSVQFAISDLLAAAAARRDRSIARVSSAVPLTSAQETRLAAALSDLYGRPIEVRTSVEPAVKGGLVIRVGDEVIDGSLASRFAAARAALAR